jgi:hypothetical protein
METCERKCFIILGSLERWVSPCDYKVVRGIIKEAAIVSFVRMKPPLRVNMDSLI